MKVFRHLPLVVLICIVTISCNQSKYAEDKYKDELDTVFLATNTRALTNIKFESTPERLKRGEYLANGILACFNCHSERDSTKAGYPPIESMKGGGSIIIENATERLVAPNITPDKETGAGNWTDDMFSRAIREGIGHDGRALSEAMFWGSFSKLSDEDLASVVVYIKSIPAVKNKLPRRKFTVEKEKELQESPVPLTGPVKHPNLSDTLTRGRYLVKIGDCVGCHTGWYKRNPGRFGGGNFVKVNNVTVFSPNITPDPTGIGGWTPEIFINVIRTGKEGSLNGVMPWTSHRNMTDEDLTAILLALQKLPPVNHRVINAQEETYCEVCEQKHGYGKYNKIVPLKAVAVDPSSLRDYAGTYINESGFEIKVKAINGKLLISKRGSLVELIAVEGNRFQSLDYLFPVSFKRDGAGKVNQMIRYSLEEEVCNRKE
ncbi:MAG: c-type cytochrome [Cyclobacteriaceae bacterium]